MPDWFIAFFYTGLGVALAVAGLTFLLRYFMNVEPGCPLLPRTYAKRG